MVVFRFLGRWLMLTCALAIAATVSAQNLRVITEQWPPFNYQEDNAPKGLATEMVQAMLKEIGQKNTILFMPWNRAYTVALKEPNVVLFTLGRSDEREALFDWVFKVAERDIWLFRLASRNEMKLTRLEDALPYKIGSGSTEDASTRDLVHAGFTVGSNLDTVQSGDPDLTNLRKLQLGRVDLIAANPLALVYAAHNLGVDMRNLTPAIRLNGGGPGYWVAISLKSDPLLARKLKNAARKLEKQGVFKAILEKYSR